MSSIKCFIHDDIVKLFLDMKINSQGNILPCDNAATQSFDWVGEEDEIFWSIKIKDINTSLLSSSLLTPDEKYEIIQYFSKPRKSEDTLKILNLSIFDRLTELKSFL